MIEKFLSPVSQEIWKMLDYAEDWSFGESVSREGIPYIIYHEKTNIALWICNGKWFLDGYKTSLYHKDNSVITTLAPKIGLVERHILWRKVRKVIKFCYARQKNQLSILQILKSFNETKLV